MKFIKVSAEQCSPDGHTRQHPKGQAVEFYLNCGLIKAIMGRHIYLKSGDRINLGQSHYTNITIHSSVNAEKFLSLW